MITGKDAHVRHTVVGNGYIGVPPTAFLVQPSFDVATSDRNWTRTHGVAAGWDCHALGGSAQVTCSDDADYERAGCWILDYRICLTRAIVECL